MQHFFIPLAVIALGAAVAAYPQQPNLREDGVAFALSILPGALVDWRVLTYPHPFKAHADIKKLINTTVQYPNYHMTFVVQSRPICASTERECGASNMSRRPAMHECRASFSFGAGVHRTIAAINSLQLSCSGPIYQ